MSSQVRDLLLFADELIFHIFCFLSPAEVIRLRVVSKQFNRIACDIRLWRILYRLSCLPRPSGPFQWQSLQFLERHLILSERISRTWTSQPLNISSRGEGPLMPSSSFSLLDPAWHLLFGRYYLWNQGTEILALDHITNTTQVLWRSSKDIFTVDVSARIFPDGQRVHVILPGDDDSFGQQTNFEQKIKLLGFSPKDDTGPSLGPVTFEIDVPMEHWFASALCANPPWLYITDLALRSGNNRDRCLVLNTQTRTMYRFPAFSSKLIESQGLHILDLTPWHTSTMGAYIITLRRDLGMKGKVLFQAFVPPSPSQPSGAGVLELRLTHETLVDGYDAPDSIHWLRDAVVCPETENTHMRSLGIFCLPDERVDYMRVDVTIPPLSPNATDILPMTVDTKRLFSCKGCKGSTFFAVSDDGYGRGGIILSGGADDSKDESSEDDESWFDFFYKFSLDASGDECTAMVGERTRLSEDEFKGLGRLMFDGFTGRTFHEEGDSRNHRMGMFDIC